MCSASAVLGAERLGDRLRDERGIAERGEADPEDAGLVLGHKRRAAASIASRVLPVPPGPVSVTRRAPSSKRDEHLEQLVVSADERARRPRQVRVGDRLQRREGAVSELEERHRLGDVLEPVLAEVGQLVLDELGGRLREDDLAAVARGGDARSEVDVVADVALVGEQRRAGVQADAHADRARLSASVIARGRGDRPRRRGEGEEERVALRVHLDAAVGGEGLAEHATVLGERLRVRLRPELVQQLRRALDVREEERDRAGGEVTHRASETSARRDRRGGLAAPVSSQSESTASRSSASALLPSQRAR